MYEVCESRCRVVALAHFSMACCQARPEAFLCQQLCVFVCLLVVPKCFHLVMHVQMLHHRCKCVSSFSASLISASMQFEGFGSREFCQSLIAWVGFLMIGCVFGDLKYDHTCV